MLRELSEDVRIRVKDRLRDFRSIVRQHRHDHGPGKPAPAEAKDQPFPIRGIEGLLGQAASAFDDVMTLAETLAPRGSPARASASMRTTVIRPTPSTSAMSFWVICSMKYIHAARIRSRSARRSVAGAPESSALPPGFRRPSA